MCMNQSNLWLPHTSKTNAKHQIEVRDRVIGDLYINGDRIPRMAWRSDPLEERNRNQHRMGQGVSLLKYTPTMKHHVHHLQDNNPASPHRKGTGCSVRDPSTQQSCQSPQKRDWLLCKGPFKTTILPVPTEKGLAAL